MTVTKVIPFSYQDHQVRTMQIDDQPYFTAIDVCETLGIKNSSDALKRLDDDEKRAVPRLNLGITGSGSVWLVNESGLYALILRSNKPEAKAFRKWITSEVLPTLRKTGAYAIGQTKEQTELQHMLDRCVALMGSQNKVADQTQTSAATLINVKEGHWAKISPDMFHHLYGEFKRILSGSIGLDAKTIHLLMQVDDKEVRLSLFEQLKNRR